MDEEPKRGKLPFEDYFSKLENPEPTPVTRDTELIFSAHDLSRVLGLEAGKRLHLANGTPFQSSVGHVIEDGKLVRTHVTISPPVKKDESGGTDT